MNLIRLLFLFVMILLLPLPSFAATLIPNGTDMAVQLYMPLIVYFNLFVLGIVFISDRAKKLIPFKAAMVIAFIPIVFALVVFVIPSIYMLVTFALYPGAIENAISFNAPIILLCLAQILVAWILLNLLFYKPLITNTKKIIGLLGIAALIALFTPKQLYEIHDTGLYFANKKPVKCTCIGVSAGKPGAIGYYCFGMPVSCVETERVGMPLEITPLK